MTSPFRNAVYSDGGFAILGQVLARLSGKTYRETVQEVLFDPLGLESMSTTAPTGSDLNVIDRRSIDKNTTWAGDMEIAASYVALFLFPFPPFVLFTNSTKSHKLISPIELVVITPTPQTSALQVSLS